MTGAWEELTTAVAQISLLFTGDRPELTPPPALSRLMHKFQLTPFERDIVLMCAAVELDAELASRLIPTFEYAFATLRDPHWSAVSVAGPLRRFQLVEPGGGSLMRGTLRIDERILDFLAGGTGRDPRLAAFIEPSAGETMLCTSQRDLASQIATEVGEDPSALLLVGDDEAANRAVALAVARNLDRELFVLKRDVAALSAIDRERLCSLWEREAKLVDGVLFVELENSDSDDGRATAILTEQLPPPLFISAREPVSLHRDANTWDSAANDRGAAPTLDRGHSWPRHIGPEPGARPSRD